MDVQLLAADAGSALPDVDATAAALTEALGGAGADEVVLLATVPADADVVATAPDDAARLPVALGRDAARWSEGRGPGCPW